MENAFVLDLLETAGTTHLPFELGLPHIYTLIISTANVPSIPTRSPLALHLYTLIVVHEQTRISSMSNIEQRFRVGEYVCMEALRFEVESIASDLCRSCSEIVPQTEKLWLHRGHRLEL